MALDTIPTYPASYDATGLTNNPPGNDKRKQGDDQFRILKANMKQTWANVAGAVTASHTELNTLTGVDTVDPIITLPVGTKMLFYQDVAPTGWTIDAAVDEHMVRLTKGSVALGQAGGLSGGTNDFSAQFSVLAEGATPGVGDHTLTGAESGTSAHTHPNTSHRHSVLSGFTSVGGNSWTKVDVSFESSVSGSGVYTDLSIGSGASLILNTTVTTPASTAANATTPHGHTVDLAAKWAACIIATKD